MLDGIMGLTPYAQVLFKSSFLALFIFTNQWEELWPVVTQPMLLLQGFVWIKYLFFLCTFFLGSDINTERGVTIYMT